ncbi:hypothetical protein BR10RB9215_C10714 [Brucella sp. 10RB9215]|uniref:restriction endonuclease subunit S n=1 Tax=Brucella sp. 10RB9215 TaxID=1149953 RepID=UPI000909B00E|nr:restriction endonuclease subunit S [Brucella sp. 10RB9215]SBW13898.1 hypothetical protein BR10RB9215_C10714 [Brucella sp. 10RB9215]
MEALAKDQSRVDVLTENSGPIGGKQTDIGTIPDGWDVQPLSQLLDFQNGFNAEKSSYGTGVPFANVLEVITKSHLMEGDIPGRVAVNANQLQAFLVRPGDILFNRTSETQDELGLASVYVGSTQIIFGGFVIRGRIKSNRLNATCAGYLLRAPAVRRQIISRGQGAVRANIGQSELGSVMVPLPPAREQEAIAEGLGDCNSLIAEIETLIAKKRRIKHGAMQKLLFGRMRLPGFSAKWKELNIGRIARIRNEKINTYGHPLAETCIELEDIEQTSGRLIAYSDARGRQATKYKFAVGDILFGRLRPYLRKFWRADRAGVCSTEIWPLTPSSQELDAGFLAHIVQTDAFIEAASAAYGTHMPRADWKSLSDLSLSLPPTIEEQSAIADILSTMDEEISALENELLKAREIRQGMMHELLTGRVRLI